MREAVPSEREGLGCVVTNNSCAIVSPQDGIKSMTMSQRPALQESGRHSRSHLTVHSVTLRQELKMKKVYPKQRALVFCARLAFCCGTRNKTVLSQKICVRVCTCVCVCVRVCVCKKLVSGGGGQFLIILSTFWKRPFLTSTSFWWSVQRRALSFRCNPLVHSVLNASSNLSTSQTW